MNKFTSLFFSSVLMVTFISFLSMMNDSKNTQEGIKNVVTYNLMNTKVILK